MLDYTRLTEAVDRAASIALSNFPAHHNISDVKQEIWVWIMENRGTVSRVLAESEGDVTALDKLMVRAASSYLKTEDAQVYGYSEEDRFNYSTDMIKSILEVVFSYEDWQSTAAAIGDGMPRGKSDPTTGGNNLASYADVKSAVEKLPEDQYNAIIWRYKYRLTLKGVGEELGMTGEGARQLLDRAVTAIQRSLGENPLSSLRNGYSGRTEARGNISGQTRVERDYEGT